MPERELDAKTVASLITDATAAPSMHNAQPWRFRFLSGPRAVQLYADLDRAMPQTDPSRRALHLGCGAALFNLRVAAAHAGWEPETHLLPDPENPQLLATVHLTDPVRAGGRLAGLHPAVSRRHTSRHPFSDKEVPEQLRTALREAAAEEGAQLTFPGAWHIDLLLELVRDAEGHDTLHPDRFDDVARWTRIGAADSDTATDGIPEYAFGPRKRDGKAPVRDFAGRRPVADRGTTAFEQNPQLALLGTGSDQPADWLRAGQAMERVLLLATLEGLATALTSHPLEVPELRRLTRDPLSDTGAAQMVLRLGYGPQGTGTPRRPVDEVLKMR
ncbi:Nitroreductase family protein [Streptomyces sp. WMMB 714]|uniref:Acg family FMN-binding oxidoreductase n=1 Tax=Streptomyces sp. WMMB 714 TaxID=1286822 RepID=UPI0005F7C473|nr:nitroreductase family protein [Streptomyces sp. WMMB 714]SCK11467.1 Nitroreductase family protein [Streptomyces sp. WMMB 714]